MAAHDPGIRRLAARKAAQSRWNKPNGETASALAEAQLANYIGRVVDRAPELTDEQRSRLALLLRDPQGVGQQESGRLTADWPPDAEQSRVESAQQAMEGRL